MRRTRDRSNALQAGTTPGWLEIFAKSNESLEKVGENILFIHNNACMRLKLKSQEISGFNSTC